MSTDRTAATGCQCGCHVGGTYRSCDVDGGMGVGCGPHNLDSIPAAVTTPTRTPEAVLCQLRHRKPALASHGQICAHHEAAVRETLADITELYALLPWLVTPLQAAGETGGGRSKKPDPPAPVNLTVLSMTDKRATWPRDPGDQLWFQETADIPDVVGVLADAAVNVLEERDQVTVRPVTLWGAVQILQRNHAWICDQTWIVEYEATLRMLRSALASVHGQHAPEPVGKCPSLVGDGSTCDGPLWPDQGNAMAVDCGTCGRHFDERFLRHLGGMMTA